MCALYSLTLEYAIEHALANSVAPVRHFHYFSVFFFVHCSTRNCTIEKDSASGVLHTPYGRLAVVVAARTYANWKCGWQSLAAACCCRHRQPNADYENSPYNFNVILISFFSCSNNRVNIYWNAQEKSNNLLFADRINRTAEAQHIQYSTGTHELYNWSWSFSLHARKKMANSQR